MFGLFGDKGAREAKRLNKDAPDVIEYTYQCFRNETVRDVAGNQVGTGGDAFPRSVYGVEREDGIRPVAKFTERLNRRRNKDDRAQEYEGVALRRAR